MTDHEIKLTRDQRFSLAGYYVLAGMFTISGIADVILDKPWLAVINYITAGVFVWCAVFYRSVYLAWARREAWYRQINRLSNLRVQDPDW